MIMGPLLGNLGAAFHFDVRAGSGTAFASSLIVASSLRTALVSLPDALSSSESGISKISEHHEENRSSLIRSFFVKGFIAM